MENCVNWKLTKKSITFYYSINWYHPVLIMEVSAINYWHFVDFFWIICATCYVNNDGKGIARVAWKT
jgi:hypothetical protein